MSAMSVSDYRITRVYTVNVYNGTHTCVALTCMHTTLYTMCTY